MSWVFHRRLPMGEAARAGYAAAGLIGGTTKPANDVGDPGSFSQLRRSERAARRLDLGRGGAIRRDRRPQRRRQDDTVQGHFGRRTGGIGQDRKSTRLTPVTVPSRM